jgi:hypothetical protein
LLLFDRDFSLDHGFPKSVFVLVIVMELHGIVPGVNMQHPTVVGHLVSGGAEKDLRGMRQLAEGKIGKKHAHQEEV